MPQTNETFHQAMERLERAGAGAEFPDDLPAVDPEADETDETDEGAGGGAEDGDKATEKSKADGDTEKASQVAAGGPGKPSADFLAEAERLGLVIDDKGRVSNRERKQFREYKAEQRQALAERERAAEERIAAIKADVLPQLSFASSAFAAWEAKDPEAIAKAFGVKDFAAFQQELIDAQADPNYKRLRELEQRDQQREKERQEAEARAAEAERRERAQVIEKRYLANLAESMSKSESKELAALAELPQVRNAIYEIQQEYWDGKSPIPPERALKLGRKGAPPLRDELLKLRDALNRAFEPEPTEEAEEVAKPVVAKKKPGKALPAGTKTAPAPKPGPSAPKDISEMTPAEYSRYMNQKLLMSEETED